MSPIKGLSEQRRIPRIGKIHLGVKKKSEKTGKEYPSATDYFVCPPEVQAVHGEKPTELPIMIPVEDEEYWASQYYRAYSQTRGLTCKGDGETCHRMIDVATGDMAGRDTKGKVEWKDMPCEGKECIHYKKEQCREVMNLQFLLPQVPGLGVWQIDTSSINSIRNINSSAELIRGIIGRIRMIPLTLSLAPLEVTNPDDGKKKTIRVMSIGHNATLQNLISDSLTPIQELLPPPPDDTKEPPLDQVEEPPLEEVIAQAEEDIDEMWGGEKSPSPTSQVTEPTRKATKDESSGIGGVKNLPEFHMLIHDEFGLQPAESLKILDKKTWTDVTDSFEACYNTIKDAVKKE